MVFSCLTAIDGDAICTASAQRLLDVNLWPVKASIWRTVASMENDICDGLVLRWWRKFYVIKTHMRARHASKE